jgi:hypothetical protein
MQGYTACKVLDLAALLPTMQGCPIGDQGVAQLMQTAIHMRGPCPAHQLYRLLHVSVKIRSSLCSGYLCSSPHPEI